MVIQKRHRNVDGVSLVVSNFDKKSEQRELEMHLAAQNVRHLRREGSGGNELSGCPRSEDILTGRKNLLRSSNKTRIFLKTLPQMRL